MVDKVLWASRGKGEFSIKIELWLRKPMLDDDDGGFFLGEEKIGELPAEYLPDIREGDCVQLFPVFPTGVLMTTYETPYFCPNCFDHIAVDWSYCPECGTSILRDENGEIVCSS